MRRSFALLLLCVSGCPGNASLPADLRGEARAAELGRRDVASGDAAPGDAAPGDRGPGADVARADAPRLDGGAREKGGPDAKKADGAGANKPPTVTLTAPVHGTVVGAGGTLALTASASDPDGTVKEVRFYAGAQLLGTDAAAPYAFSWSGAAVGVHRLSARAVDDDGAETTSATALVTVTASQRPVAAAFVHFGYSATDDALSTTALPGFLDDMVAVGVDTLIVSQTRVKQTAAGCGGTAASFEWVAGFPGKLQTILDEAKLRGMTVFVGTTMAMNACGSLTTAPNPALVQADTATHMASLHASYGAHAAFAGFYIPDEPGHLGASGHPYYAALASTLKGFSSKPVAVAPFLAGSPPPPATLAANAVAFKNATKVDLQIWQDSVGAAAIRLYPWSRAGATTEEYYSALAGALGAGLWADVELFNYGDPLFNTSGKLSGGYRSASAMRLNAQLWSSRFAARRAAWLHQWHLCETIGPARGFGEARRLREAFRALYGIAGSYLLKPSTPYTWQTPPSASYPDSGGELTDTHTGDPLVHTDKTWVGVNGTATMTFDLGAATQVDWVAAHVLAEPSPAIAAPSAIELRCSTNGSSFALVRAEPSPIAGVSLSGVTREEYVIGNLTPLAATGCRYLRVTLVNSAWTFVSEVEVVRE